jgi:hypothetical protein
MDGSPASTPRRRNSRRLLQLRHAGRPALAGIVAAIGFPAQALRRRAG